VNGVAFGPGGAVLAAADGNGQAYAWEVATSALLGAFADPPARA
jgi:hypothetical protein